MSLTKEKKAETIEKLKSRFDKSVSVYFFDYQHVPVSAQQTLRRKLLENRSEYQVAKNTLIRLALGDKESEAVNAILNSPTAILFAYEDEISPLKALVEFSKDFEKMSIKGGLLDDTFYDAEVISQLSQLPSKQELLASFVGSLASPMNRFVGSMRSPMQGFTSILKQLSEK